VERKQLEDFRHATAISKMKRIVRWLKARIKEVAPQVLAG
jgi:hypothetical protein